MISLVVGGAGGNDVILAALDDLKNVIVKL